MATADLDDIPRLDVGPRNWLEPFELGCDHQEFKHLIVDLVGDLPLSQLEGDVSNGHQGDIYREGDHGEGDAHVIVLLRHQDKEEEHHGEEVLEVIDAIDDEVPDSKQAIVSVGIDLVGVHKLVSDKLMALTTLKLHLLFEVLVFILQTAFFLILGLLIVNFVKPLLVSLVVGHNILIYFSLAWSSNRCHMTVDTLHAEEPRLILLNTAHRRLLWHSNSTLRFAGYIHI